jgi:hypothetical protein
MDRKGVEKGSAVRSKSHRGRKRLGASAPKSERVIEPKKVRAGIAPVSSTSSDSYSTDEDYAEFLKTYNPQESYTSSSDEIDVDYAKFLKTYDPQEVYPLVSSPREGKSNIILESKRKETPKSPKVASDYD